VILLYASLAHASLVYTSPEEFIHQADVVIEGHIRDNGTFEMAGGHCGNLGGIYYRVEVSRVLKGALEASEIDIVHFVELSPAQKEAKRLAQWGDRAHLFSVCPVSTVSEPFFSRDQNVILPMTNTSWKQREDGRGSNQLRGANPLPLPNTGRPLFAVGTEMPGVAYWRIGEYASVRPDSLGTWMPVDMNWLQVNYAPVRRSWDELVSWIHSVALMEPPSQDDSWEW
jgi:hypothetical protein